MDNLKVKLSFKPGFKSIFNKARKMTPVNSLSNNEEIIEQLDFADKNHEKINEKYLTTISAKNHEFNSFQKELPIVDNSLKLKSNENYFLKLIQNFNNAVLLKSKTTEKITKNPSSVINEKVLKRNEFTSKFKIFKKYNLKIF